MAAHLGIGLSSKAIPVTNRHLQRQSCGAVTAPGSASTTGRALCVDNIGNSTPTLYASSHTFLKEGVKFVFVGGAINGPSFASLSKSLVLPAFLSGGKRKFLPFKTENNRADLEQLRDWLVKGKVRTVIHSTFEFDEADKAIEKVREGLGGKIIVRVQEK